MAITLPLAVAIHSTLTMVTESVAVVVNRDTAMEDIVVSVYIFCFLNLFPMKEDGKKGSLEERGKLICRCEIPLSQPSQRMLDT